MKTWFVSLFFVLSLNASVAKAGLFSVPAFLHEGYPTLTGCSYTFSKSKTIVAMYDELMNQAVLATNADKIFVSLSEFNGKLESTDLFYAVQKEMISKRSTILSQVSPYNYSRNNLVYGIDRIGQQVNPSIDVKKIAEFVISHVDSPNEQDLWMWGQLERVLPSHLLSKEQVKLQDDIRTKRFQAKQSVENGLMNLMKTVYAGPLADGKNPWSYELVQATSVGRSEADPKFIQTVADFYPLTLEYNFAAAQVNRMGFDLGFASDLKEEIIDTVNGNLDGIELRSLKFEDAVAAAYRVYGGLAHLRITGQIDQKMLTEVLESVKVKSEKVFSKYKEYATEIRSKTQKLQLFYLNSFFYINGGSIGLPNLGQ